MATALELKMQSVGCEYVPSDQAPKGQRRKRARKQDTAVSQLAAFIVNLPENAVLRVPKEGFTKGDIRIACLINEYRPFGKARYRVFHDEQHYYIEPW